MKLDVDEVVVIINIGNIWSWGLMERLGMICDYVGDFDYVLFVEGDLLWLYIFYCIVCF